MKDSKIPLGSVVRLKSSCRSMTVVGKATKGWFKRSRHCECVWYDVDFELNAYWFPEESIELTDEKTQPSGFLASK